MTISSENYRKQYSGNGLTTVFPYDFKITAASQLNVIVTSSIGVETTKVLDTDYSVSGVGVDGGGNVTYPISGTPLPTGSLITIRRVVSLTQLTNLINQTAFQAQTLETSLDYQTMIAQQLKEESQRSIRIPVSEDNEVTLPVAQQRKNSVLGFDSNGNLIMIPAVDSLASFRQAGSTVDRTVTEKLYESISVKDFGAVGDGVTDDTAAIQNALNSGAGCIVFPSGVYLISDEFIINTGAFNSLFIKGSIARSIDGVGVRIKQTSIDKGVFVFGSSSTSFTDLRIEGIQFYGTNSGTGSGITLNKSSAVRISDCQFWYWGCFGIYLKGDINTPNYDVEIEKSRFCHNNTVGIYSDYMAVNSINIHDNTFNNLNRTDNRHGIELSGFVINIYYNTIQTLNDGIRIDAGYNVNIENNYIENCGNNHIRIAHDGDIYALKIKGNHLYNASSVGFDSVMGYAHNIYGAEIGANTIWNAIGKKKYNFVLSSIYNIVLFASHNDTPTIDYSFAAGVYPLIIGDTFRLKTFVATLSNSLVIAPSDGNVFYLDPNASDRDVTFTGTFPVGHSIKIFNTGDDNDLVMTSYGNLHISKQMFVRFEYMTGGWAITEITGRETVAVSSGTFTIKSGSANNSDSIGWLQIQPGIWVPYTTNPIP